MFYRLKKSINTNYYNFIAKKILHTPPLKTSAGKKILIVSMVSHDDLLPYLVSIKSFYHFLDEDTEISVLNDGSLTEEDISIINKHISPKEIVNIINIDTGKCPRGGTWERLVYIIEKSVNYYVIQLDSDIATIGNITEIKEYIRLNKSYTLKGDIGSPGIENLMEASERAQKSVSIHIQTIIEKNLCLYPDYQNLLYVRGCSAFAGFGKGLYTKDKLEMISANMQSISGLDKWNEWGSEQITSNFVIANTKDSVVLPYNKYTNYYPYEQDNWDSKSLIHFIGTYRYKNGLYFKKTMDIINLLSK